jgi:hypothetical protein
MGSKAAARGPGSLRPSPVSGRKETRLSCGGCAGRRRAAASRRYIPTSDRGALLRPRRLRGVELSIALLDAASPLVPGNDDPDMVRARPLACSGDFLLRLAVCHGKDLIAEGRRGAGRRGARARRCAAREAHWPAQRTGGDRACACALQQRNAGKEDSLSQHADHGNEGGRSSAITRAPTHYNPKISWRRALYSAWTLKNVDTG